MQFALTYASGAYDLDGKIMGRQAAGAGFLRAAVAARPDRIWCHAASRDLAERFGRAVTGLTSSPPELRFVSTQQPAGLTAAGLLYRPDPDIRDPAWARQRYAGARSYSLCGVTHTLASRDTIAALADLPDAPLYSWDAVICTSTVARDLVARVIGARLERLKSRFNATTFTLPQFPLIPLGVHCADFSTTSDARAEARRALQIDADDVAFVFTGRLTFHAKAHPLPMLIGLQRAAAASGRALHLIVFGLFPNTSVEEAFRAEAAQLMPSVRLVYLDGTVAGNGARARAAADVFTSLSDNIQETFGLTPVEAMAAGLPVVVSDWDGYKDTVRDGVDGFRVPTAMPPPGAGNDLAARYELGATDYDRYIGEVSLFTAVDVSAAASAYLRLIESPELRRRMGEAGRRRAVESYDWSVIFRRYVALWDELAERRRSDLPAPGEQSRSGRPGVSDPFDLFSSFATAPIGPTTRVRLYPGATATEAVARTAMRSVSYAAPVLPSDEIIAGVIEHLALNAAGLTLSDLASALATIPAVGITRAVAFMAKTGIVDLSPS